MLIQYLIFVRSQMINQEDYTMIADYDCMGFEERGIILEQKGDQVLIKRQIILLVTTHKV